jgi:acetylornithine deacetylase/succinyl-diaminopimelate desuccinylase-like protein
MKRIGSGTSRAAIEREARRSNAVLVLEPAPGLDGRVKTGRKGVGEIEIIATGRAAHAGPQSGRRRQRDRGNRAANRDSSRAGIIRAVGSP